MSFVIFTDLDGTLLDHASYSYAPAKPALALLHKLDIPLILASSKTAFEIAPLREELGFAHCPAIVENGAGLLPAGAEPESLAGAESDYQRIRAILDQMPADLRRHFTGFGDWSIEEIAAQTGLPQQNAALAARRLFSEPGLFTGNADEKRLFEDHIEKQGLKARQGGRYFTLSFGATKADQMQGILKERSAATTSIISIALGDAANDIEMLETADYGVIINNPAGKPLSPLKGEQNGHILRTEEPGPIGWNRAILDHIGRLQPV
ncbi:HAD-IIB family hydrolase [uncultured Cohaesibacter sp.]|uniref:HAD-IIB family hydrolase n=1 Tax=uncultured Cohaesibacter sp. TaxID=1002546 RepID=UPI0029C7F62C|nr:HAD-IIB family hydrolase [uncultured Cohaesibacter sp.]